MHGVDRGNWDPDIDWTPLHDYVDALFGLESEYAHGMLQGRIREAAGPMIADLIQEELGLEEEHP